MTKWKKHFFFDHPLLITPCWGLTSSNLNPHLEFRNSKGKIFYTRKLKISSVVEMNRRLRMEKEAYKRQYSAIHSSPSMHSSRRVIIKPRSLTWINAHISSKGIANPHSFLSYFAKDGNKLTIPNFTLSKRQHCCRLPVINETEQFITFPEGKVLGGVVQHQKQPMTCEATPTIYHLISGKVLQEEVTERIVSELHPTIPLDRQTKLVCFYGTENLVCMIACGLVGMWAFVCGWMC